MESVVGSVHAVSKSVDDARSVTSEILELVLQAAPSAAGEACTFLEELGEGMAIESHGEDRRECDADHWKEERGGRHGVGRVVVVRRREVYARSSLHRDFW